MNKILFPFELDSPFYREAYVYAVKFARNMYAELLLFNTFNIEVDNSITQESYNLLVRKKWLHASAEINKFNAYYLEKFAKVGEEYQVCSVYKFLHGKFIIELRKVLKDEAVDLLVLPVTLNTEKNKKILQIIHDDIFEQNTTSILVVPEGSSYTPIKNVLFATDLKKLKYHDLYLNDVLRYASIFNAKIHFLHINPSEKAFLPEDSDAYRTMMQIIELEKKHVFKSMHGKNISDSIKEYSKNNSIDLLVTVKHEHGLLESLIHKSTSDELVLKSNIPVLVMREKDEF